MKQATETPVGVSAGRLALAYKELFPGEFDLKNLPEIEETMGNWLERYYREPEKAIATQNWTGKVTQALFHALGIGQPKTKKAMLELLKNSPKAVRIVEYQLDYVHRVQVGVPSVSDEDAIAQAEEAYDKATLWDDVSEMPLLYDSFEEMEGNVLNFKVVTTMPGMFYPEPDQSAGNRHKDEAAKSACSMLIAAVQSAKQSGKDSVSLAELEAACEAAIEAESGYKEPLKVLVEIEGGACIGTYSNRPVDVIIMDADKAKYGEVDRETGDRLERIAFPDGIDAKTVLCGTEVKVVPEFVREVFAKKDGAEETREAA